MASHKPLSLTDVALIADTIFLLVRVVLAFVAHRRHSNSTRRPHVLEADASYLSQLLFLWIWPLLSRGYAQQSITTKDLPPLHPTDATATLVAAFRRHWAQFPAHSLPRHLHAVCWRTFYHSAALMLVVTAANIANPLLLHGLLQALTSPSVDAGHAAGLAALWCVALVVNCVFVHQFWSVAVRCGMHTRSILQQFVFEKALTVSHIAGHVHALLAVDATRICDNYVVCFVHWDTWSAVVTLSVCVYFLFDLLSYSALVWLIVTLLYAPCAAFFGRRIQIHSAAHQHRRDARTSVFTQMLRGVLTMKANAYDAWCEGRLDAARRRELEALQWKAIHGTFNTSVLVVAQVIAPMASFVVFVHVQGGRLDAATAFSALAWFSTAASPLLRLPKGLTTVVDATVSLNRLEAFFRSSERRDGLASRPSSSVVSTHLYYAIELKSVTCSWNVTTFNTEDGHDGDNTNNHHVQRRQLFAELTLVVPKGQFVVCCGPVGCGKSSFLDLCVQMLPVSAGQVLVHGTVAYCPQTPWIQNTSVRDNILFGLPMDRMWYKMTLHMCALDDDLALWPHGDATVAGDQGARAIYSRRNILLLDNVLASLDSHVGDHIFTRCLCSPALMYMTKVVVTNQPAFIAHAAVDRVLCFEHANDSAMRGDFTVQSLAPPVFKRSEGASIDSTAATEPPSTGKGHRRNSTLPLLAERLGESSPDDSKTREVVVRNAPHEPAAPEPSRQGALDLRILMLYVKSLGSPCAVAGCGFLFVVEHGLVLGGAYCLGQWSHSSDDDMSSSKSTSFQTLFIVLGLVQACTSVVRKVLFVVLSLAASASVHTSVVRALVRASMRFFDTTSPGVILNRCITDVASVDETIPYVVSSFLANGLDIVMSFVAVAATAPLVLAVVLLLVYPYMYLYKLYRWPARDLKRLQSAARSPILSHFNEVSQGVNTVAAFDAAAAVSATSMRVIDASVQAYWPSLVANQWVTLWLELLGIGIVAAAAAACVWLRATDQLHASGVGVVLTYAAQLPGRMGWMLKMLAAIEVECVALERLDELTIQAEFYKEDPPESGHLDGEANMRFGDGTLHFHHVSMSYGGHVVLRDIHVDIPTHAKVAVVGRTGAGKSSLVRALLGLYPIHGSIQLGTVALSSLSTTTLRRQVLGFIPQDAVLLGQTLWEGLVGDVAQSKVILDTIERFLDQVGMLDAVDQLQNGLDTPLTDVAFSGGELQLLCVARALLRPGHVLICDEATAYMDAETDGAIHRLLFALPRTVLTICHRVHHLMEYDVVLVLDKGRLVEAGPPHELLAAYPNGMFASLVDTSSRAES
ncbi:hypothetical protein DYB38_003060 [Aphanomyces astaci]|uniref:ABC transporter domain-containing protein n=1 Tax=Aphanomyces astaci TaxID=112090 RepID=A0A397DIV1_APHAT|nr:hypothetical protein DYB38_003060 [Aphanomyces astaci]